ncbi:transglycosylase SLT domain-containing protein [Kitasatospora phosalacinea]|uniref:aggregation-promoting factor C-terminal-like domain-containing protein n=1 Tax=Kitasatospora phosalacinea TaxID=2065 RepID=UPI000524406B|nr:transglycosylase SLT domain-containing protein [Kitasatospora phosalacinea]
MTRISVRSVAVVSATAVTAVGAVVGAAAGSEGKGAVQTVDVASATLLADAPTGAQAQNVSDGIVRQADAQQVSADTAARKAAEEAARQKAAADAQAKADADKATKAAEDKAAADKAAADKAAETKAAKQQANQAAAQSPLAAVPSGSVQEIARQIIGDDAQFQCFSQIVTRESGWNYTATNASSGAYGLVQALPGSKMATAGADWRTNPATQIKWGLNYMNSRYGSPCGAWSFWQSHHWY